MEPADGIRAIPSVSSDGEVFRRARADPSAFVVIYERHADTVRRFAARRVGPEIADDVLSETFLVAFERRGRFETHRDSALPWLLGIVVTLLKRHRRIEARQWLAIEAAGHTLDDDPTPTPDERLDAQAEIRRLAAAIRRLPSGEREALLLYAWADLGYEGIAEALHVPVGTVRSRLHRARTKLRAAAQHPGPTGRGQKEEHHGPAGIAAIDA